MRHSLNIREEGKEDSTPEFLELSTELHKCPAELWLYPELAETAPGTPFRFLLAHSVTYTGQGVTLQEVLRPEGPKAAF